MGDATTLVIVNWFAAELAANAIRSARAASADPLEVVLVDNSCDAEEGDRLRGSGADRVIASPVNLGFGAAVNLALQGNSAPVVIAANPDVVFERGSIDLLVEGLGGGVGVTGPRFTWDGAGRWLLPPASLPTRRGELDRIAASRSASWRRRRDQRRIAARLAFWRATVPLEVEALSGAVLCMRGEAFRASGGFDPRFRLYFEEIDLVRTLARLGWRARYLPQAVCHHLYDQSAKRHEQSAALYGQSEQEFLRKSFGEGFRRVVSAWRRPLPPLAAEPWPMRTPVPLPRGRWLVEASPDPAFETAAGRLDAAEAVILPDEILRGLRAPELFLRVIEPWTCEVTRVLHLREAWGSA